MESPGPLGDGTPISTGVQFSTPSAAFAYVSTSPSIYLSVELERQLFQRRATRSMPLKEQIHRITYLLALSKSDLARLLGVSRPALYSWMQEKKTPRQGKTERLRALLGVANQVEEKLGGPVPARLCQEVEIDGQSLFAQLSEERMDLDLVEELIQALALQFVQSRMRSARASLEEMGLRREDFEDDDLLDRNLSTLID